MGCSLPGFSVYGILQARRLAMTSSGDLPDPGIEPTSLMSPAPADRFFTTSATWQSPAETLYPLPTALHLPYPTQLLATNFLLFVSLNLIFFFLKIPHASDAMQLFICLCISNIFFGNFKFLKFIYFNWRLISLQYCSGFAIHWHESAMGLHEPHWTPLQSPSPSHPSGSSQCTSPKHETSGLMHQTWTGNLFHIW